MDLTKKDGIFKTLSLNEEFDSMSMHVLCKSLGAMPRWDGHAIHTCQGLQNWKSRCMLDLELSLNFTVAKNAQHNLNTFFVVLV